MIIVLKPGADAHWVDAVAVGANGLMTEVHTGPEEARSDARQALRPAAFGELVAQIRQLAELLGKRMPTLTEVSP